MKRAHSEKQKARREEDILQAALQQFAKCGFHATRMDDIATAAGVSKGTIYLYFSDKNSLFRALLTQKVGVEARHLTDILGAHSDLETALSSLAQQMTTLLVDSPLPKLLRVLICESTQFPEMVAFYRQNIIEPTLPVLASRLGGEHALIAAKLVIAPMVFSLLWQEVFFSHTPPEREQVKALLDTQYKLVAQLCQENVL